MLFDRPDHHDHLAAFHLGHILDLADLDRIGGHAFQQLPTQIQVRHLASPESQRHLDLVAILKKPEHVAHLDIIVVHIGVGPELDLFDLDDLLLLAGLGLFLLGLVFELTEIHDLDDRRVRIRRNLDQIQPGLLGQLHATPGRYHPHIFAVGADKSDFCRINPVVHAGAGVTLWRGVVGSAGYG